MSFCVLLVRSLSWDSNLSSPSAWEQIYDNLNLKTTVSCWHILLPLQIPSSSESFSAIKHLLYF
jgi:hypothetical protein